MKNFPGSNASSIQQLIANEQPMSTTDDAAAVRNLTEQIDLDEVVFSNDGTTTTMTMMTKKRRSPSNATLQSIGLDGFDNLSDIDQVQILPNSFENIIMSNIDRTLHGDFDGKNSSAAAAAAAAVGNVNLPSEGGTCNSSNSSSSGSESANKQQCDSGNNLSASKLRKLQESTMIESALDLDTLEEQSVVSINSGNSSQTGLLKCTPASVYH
ncbi:hypothetical protein Phum_PHUM602220 [Pediculus humanus corporis]|uniref:Uncharacterized protein n=1 Tax=Pediculus humanus subsp. corporis TaxID=121224 RepID=E0W386_PEDHC|nr:uncharacterized protein Phum_PHUM602220 [Pediculus humanus corporis]EEB20092.1 hypothetical protein Phum_PHUM602220 [Pediculus humanus corporis]